MNKYLRDMFRKYIYQDRKRSNRKRERGREGDFVSRTERKIDIEINVNLCILNENLFET